ncbi:MAG TPA: serine/threonine-protein kinase, partial [Myxococcales bacterium]|nr:serine/threonine-protein kinase [Myxococcales bacterium]
MSHLDEDALLRFVQHDLSPEHLAQAEAHLRGCNLCRRAVALLAETEAHAPDSWPTPSPAPPQHATGGASGLGLGPARPARRGKQIDRYVVLEVLGAGSMGVVYAAFDPKLDRKIALKMLAGESGDRGSFEERRARMMREAQAMARLSHPNVVHVHDVGTYQDQIYVAMEFIQGQRATEWLRSEPRSWREVLRVFIRAGRGLAAAHAAGLVHRDFKPDNVMVGNDGVARVMDFGLVSSISADPNAWNTPPPVPVDRGSEADLAQPITQAGALLGTPAYMAPEQWMGDKIDHRADQFSFCVSLYEALYGQRPFAARTLAELTSKVAQGKIREVPAGSPVPFYIRRAVARGLAADPKLRHPSMKELLEVLELGLRVPRRRVLFTAGGAVLLVVGGLLAPLLWRLRSPDRATEPPAAAANERPPERCGRAAETFATAWNEARERALGARLLQAGGPAAAEVWVHAQRFIDRFRERWVASRERACRAGAAPRLAERRLECLDQQLDELRALEEVLGKADASLVRGAALAAAALPSPEGCAEERGLPEDAPGPARRAWRHQLVVARATLAAGDPAGARKLADALLQAQGLDRATEAEALV